MSSEIDSKKKETNEIEKENEYSSVEMLLPDFVQKHKNILPQVIFVVNEHKSQNSVEEVPAEQVLYASSVVTVRRLMAKSADGKYISVPFLYTAPIFLLNRKGKIKRRTFARDLFSQSEGKKFKFSSNPNETLNLGETEVKAEDLGVMEIMEFYEESYMMAHRIVNGEPMDTLDPKPVVFATFLNINIRVIYGQEGVSEEDWNKQVDSFKRQLEKPENQVKIQFKRLLTYDENDMTIHPVLKSVFKEVKKPDLKSNEPIRDDTKVKTNGNVIYQNEETKEVRRNDTEVVTEKPGEVYEAKAVTSDGTYVNIKEYKNSKQYVTNNQNNDKVLTSLEREKSNEKVKENYYHSDNIKPHNDKVYKNIQQNDHKLTSKSIFVEDNTYEKNLSNGLLVKDDHMPDHNETMTNSKHGVVTIDRDVYYSNKNNGSEFTKRHFNNGDGGYLLKDENNNDILYTNAYEDKKMADENEILRRKIYERESPTEIRQKKLISKPPIYPHYYRQESPKRIKIQPYHEQNVLIERENTLPKHAPSGELLHNGRQLSSVHKKPTRMEEYDRPRVIRVLRDYDDDDLGYRNSGVYFDESEYPNAIYEEDLRRYRKKKKEYSPVREDYYDLNEREFSNPLYRDKETIQTQKYAPEKKYILKKPVLWVDKREESPARIIGRKEESERNNQFIMSKQGSKTVERSDDYRGFPSQYHSDQRERKSRSPYRSGYEPEYFYVQNDYKEVSPRERKTSSSPKPKNISYSYTDTVISYDSKNKIKNKKTLPNISYKSHNIESDEEGVISTKHANHERTISLPVSQHKYPIEQNFDPEINYQRPLNVKVHSPGYEVAHAQKSPLPEVYRNQEQLVKYHSPQLLQYDNGSFKKYSKKGHNSPEVNVKIDRFSPLIDDNYNQNSMRKSDKKHVKQKKIFMVDLYGNISSTDAQNRYIPREEEFVVKHRDHRSSSEVLKHHPQQQRVLINAKNYNNYIGYFPQPTNDHKTTHQSRYLRSEHITNNFDFPYTTLEPTHRSSRNSSRNFYTLNNKPARTRSNLNYTHSYYMPAIHYAPTKTDISNRDIPENVYYRDGDIAPKGSIRTVRGVDSLSRNQPQTIGVYRDSHSRNSHRNSMNNFEAYYKDKRNSRELRHPNIDYSPNPHHRRHLSSVVVGNHH